jgi:class 3 adenylate cyclase
VFCAASPALRPHVIAQIAAPAKSRTEHVLPLRRGDLLLRTLGRQRPVERADGEPPAELEVRIAADAVSLVERGDAGGGPTKLVVVSELDEPAHLVIERGTWASEAVLGSAVASLPEFIELFATEAPASGLELTVGRLALLFSDLTGSTALYERVGDARAFAIVQEHFRAMEAIVAANDGAVVKTMGDAVMASFSRIDQAARAAIAMVESTQREHGELGIGVKLGFHEGPCLAVRANDRLDFFGTTVNVAARLQAQAHSSELVVTQDIASTLGDVLGQRPVRRFRAALKGIAAEQDLVGFDLSERASIAERARDAGT